MKFAPPGRSPAGLTRRTQWQLIGLIVLLGVVIGLAQYAARPEVWAWVAGKPAPPAGPDVADNAAPRTPAEGYAGLVSEASVAAARDNTVGLSRTEAAGLSQLVSELSNTQHGTLSRAARGDVTFAVLMADSDAYRGQVISARGQLRRLLPWPAPAGADFPEMFEAWVFGEDADGRPYRVLTTAADGLPRGEQFDPVLVQFDGVFFKRTAYASEGGTGLTPTLVARRITAVPVAPSQPGDRVGNILPLFVAIAMAFAVLAFFRSQSGRKKRIAFTVGGGGETDGPGDISAESPGEFLSNLTVEDGPDVDPRTTDAEFGGPLIPPTASDLA